MELMKDSLVVEYMSLMDGMSVVAQLVPLSCGCVESDSPGDAHEGTRNPFSDNMAEVSFTDRKLISASAVYITNVSYFKCKAMAFMINSMRECRDVDEVEGYNSVLLKNFRAHPPCAQYMSDEYEELMLTPQAHYLNKMSLWDHLVDTFCRIRDGTMLYGMAKVSDLAFVRTLNFCAGVLRIDFEMSKKNRSQSLITKCLKYYPGKRTRSREIAEFHKLLDIMFNTGFNFRMQIVNLAILTHQMQNI